MAQLVVRNIEEEVKARLRRRAAAHKRSMEEEVRDILRNAVKGEAKSTPRLGSRLRRRFSAIGLDEDIREWRGTTAIPASFDE
jgi:plasmid stability protein